MSESKASKSRKVGNRNRQAEWAEAIEFPLRSPLGFEITVVVPQAAVVARRKMAPDEEADIVEALQPIYALLGRRLDKQKAKWFDRVTRPRMEPQVKAMAALRRSMAIPESSDVMEMWRLALENRRNPRLLEAVLELAGDSRQVLFHEEFHPLLESAVKQALDIKDEAFFVKLGAAFARARKARRKPQPLPVSMGKELIAPHIEFLVEWWITQDGQGPQLCMFADQALAAFLECIFDDEDKQWLDIVRKAKRRYGLVSSQTQMIGRVDYEEDRQSRTERLFLRLR